MVKKNQFIF